MKARRKFILWVAVLYAALLAVPVALGVLLSAGLPTAQQEAFLALVAERAPVLAFATLILFFVCVGTVKWLFGE